MVSPKRLLAAIVVAAVAVLVLAVPAWAPNRREHDHIGQFNLKLEVPGTEELLLASRAGEIRLTAAGAGPSLGGQRSPGVEVSPDVIDPLRTIVVLSGLLEGEQTRVTEYLDGKGDNAKLQLSMWNGKELARWTLEGPRVGTVRGGGETREGVTLDVRAIGPVELDPSLARTGAKGRLSCRVNDEAVRGVRSVTLRQQPGGGGPAPGGRGLQLDLSITPGDHYALWQALTQTEGGAQVEVKRTRPGQGKTLAATGCTLSGWFAGPAALAPSGLGAGPRSRMDSETEVIEIVQVACRELE